MAQNLGGTSVLESRASTGAPRCRLCGTDLAHTFVDLGMSPPCESYLSADQLDAGEVFYPLHVRVCAQCLLVQLPAYIPPEDIFRHYAYFSSYSDSWVRHAERFVEAAIERLGLGPGSFVVEVASNDGYLLQHASPAASGPWASSPPPTSPTGPRPRGSDRDPLPRRAATGAEVAPGHGRADLVVANNVFAHVPDIVDFGKGLRALVADTGTVTIEIPHLMRLIEGNEYDTIYHEHYSYLSLLTTQRVLAEAGLTVVDVEELPTHGGSLRTWSRPGESGGQPPRRSWRCWPTRTAAGLHTLDGHVGSRQSVARVRNDLRRVPRGVLAGGQAGRRPTARRARATPCSTTVAIRRT